LHRRRDVLAGFRGLSHESLLDLLMSHHFSEGHRWALMLSAADSADRAAVGIENYRRRPHFPLVHPGVSLDYAFQPPDFPVMLARGRALPPRAA
jgi:hypothetical protein